MAQKAIFNVVAVRPLELKKIIFGHVVVIGFNICCSVSNFIKIGRFCTEIGLWRFNDFQNGGRPPCWIFEIGSHGAFVGMPFCLLVQNFAEIGQSVDELWPTENGFQHGGRPSS